MTLTARKMGALSNLFQPPLPGRVPRGPAFSHDQAKNFSSHTTMSIGESNFTFPSMRATSAASGIPYSVLQAWKAGGLPGFEQSGRVDLRTVLAAAFGQTDNGDLAPPAGMRNWREALNKAQAQRTELKLATEKRALVERAWVAARIQDAASEINRARLKSETEHAALFAAAGGDVSECRTVLRGIWDEVLRAIQAAGAHFKETASDEKTTTQ